MFSQFAKKLKFQQFSVKKILTKNVWKYSLALSIFCYTQKSKLHSEPTITDKKNKDPLWRSKARVSIGDQ